MNINHMNGQKRKLGGFFNFWQLSVVLLTAFFITTGILFAQTAPRWSGPISNPPGDNKAGYIYNTDDPSFSGVQSGSINITGEIAAGSLDVTSNQASVGGSEICVASDFGGECGGGGTGSDVYWELIGDDIQNTNSGSVNIQNDLKILGGIQNDLKILGGDFYQNSAIRYITPTSRYLESIVGSGAGTYLDADTFNGGLSIRDSNGFDIIFFGLGANNMGNIGIGTKTPNPDSSLHIKTGSGSYIHNAEIDLQSLNNDPWAIYQDYPTEDLRFWHTNVPGDKNALAITNEGNVGVGTVTPTVKFEVGDPTAGSVAQLRVTDTNAEDDPAIQLQYGTGANDYWGFIVDQASDTVRLRGMNPVYPPVPNEPPNRDLITFTKQGQVGIGVQDYGGNNDPSRMTMLTVAGDITVGGSVDRGKIRFYPADNTDASIANALGSEGYFNTYGPSAAYPYDIGHKFYVHGNEVAAQIGIGSLTVRADRLSSMFNGNVGIGLGYGVYPDEKLAINDTVAGSAARVRIMDVDDNPELQLQNSSNPADHWGLYVNNDAAANLGVGDLGIWGGGENRLIITQAGDVVIAPTTQLYDAGYARFRVDRLAEDGRNSSTIKGESSIGPAGQGQGEDLHVAGALAEVWPQMDGGRADYIVGVIGIAGDDSSADNWMLSGGLGASNSLLGVNTAVFGAATPRYDTSTIKTHADFSANTGGQFGVQPLWAGYFVGNVYIGNRTSQTGQGPTERLTVDGNVKINGNLEVTGTINGGGGGANQVWSCDGDCPLTYVDSDMLDVECPSGYRIVTGGAWCNYNFTGYGNSVYIMRETRPVYWSSTLNGFTRWRASCENGQFGGFSVVCEQVQ